MKQRILTFYFLCHKPPTITRLLEGEGIMVSRGGCKVSEALPSYWNNYEATWKWQENENNKRGQASGWRAHETWWWDNSYATSHPASKPGIHHVFANNFTPPNTVGLDLPWQCLLPAYSWKKNKMKHLEWARRNWDEDFSDISCTDECSVQQESHQIFCCRKCGEPPKSKPRYV